MMLLLLVIALITGILAINSLRDCSQMASHSMAISILSAVTLESLVYFWCRNMAFPFHFGLILWTAMSSLLLFYNRKKLQPPKLEFATNPIYLAGLAFILLASLLFYRYHNAYGAWDAVAIWNTHANFLATPDNNWKNLFDSSLTWSHPDYPLLIPSFIGSFWYAIKSINPIIPLFYHMGIMLIFLTSFFKIIFDKHKLTALIFLGILCLDRHFIARMSSEYADTTIALIYMLISYVLLDQFWKKKKFNALFLGFLVAIPLWVKNEGLPFFLIFFSFYVFSNRKSQKNVLLFMTGAFPIIFSYIYFKYALAPENHIVQSQNLESILQKLTDFSRYKLIVSKLITTLFWSFPLLVVAILTSTFISIRDKSTSYFLPISILSLCFLAYLAVYLVSPYDLEWHVQHSITRLIHQVYPAMMLVSAYTISIFFNKKEAFIF